MKRIAIIALATAMAFMSGSNLGAQGKYGADSAECIKYLSYYKEYFKQKNYNDATPNWRKAYTLCPPTANQTMIVDGTTLVRRLITQNASNETYKAALIDTLLTLHDIRAKYYPKYAITSLNNKGTDMANYLKDDTERLYKGLNEIIAANGSETKASILMFDLNAAISLYQNGAISDEEVISTYQNNLALIESATAENEEDKEQNAKVKSDMEGLFITSKVASCENLISLFTPRYESDPNNYDLAGNIVKMMSSTEDCTDNELYLRAATTMHRLQPTFQSAYYLYRLNSSRNNIPEAGKYMEEALNFPDIDVATKAAYSYEYATFCVKNSMPSKGMNAARTALELDSSYAGKCYFLMGTIWGTTSCGGDEITRRAPYWVAVDYMQKARAADPSLSDECGRMIAQYSVYFPQTAEAFMYDLTSGQSYTVSCGGLTATTTVRTQD